MGHNAGCADGDRATTTAQQTHRRRATTQAAIRNAETPSVQNRCDGKQEEDVAGADGVSDREPPQTEVAEESRSR